MYHVTISNSFKLLKYDNHHAEVECGIFYLYEVFQPVRRMLNLII